MVGWHHQLNGYDFEQALGAGDGQGGLVCCNSWGLKSSLVAQMVKHLPAMQETRVRSLGWEDLQEFTQTHFHQVRDAIKPSHPW